MWRGWNTKARSTLKGLTDMVTVVTAFFWVFLVIGIYFALRWACKKVFR
jgi:hypothetical protein